MIDLPTLYPHQETLRDDTRAALVKHGRVILCAGCGVGKTRISKWILGKNASKERKQEQSGHALFAVAGRGLVSNASSSFGDHPALPHGVLMSGEETAIGHRVQVGSIDTLLSWFIEDDKYANDMTFDLIVVDECDYHAVKFARFLKYHDAKREQLGLRQAFVIGLTATPQAKGLGDVYQEIVSAPPTQWLIDNGFLAPFRYFLGKQGQLERLRLKGGKFTVKSECEAMDGLAGDLVRDWKQHAEGRPTVGFFPRRSHAREAMELLQDAGLRVDYVDCFTSDDLRKNIFWQLDNGKLDYVCNVNLVARGTDIPAISCVQLCVAIHSPANYLQKVGRGSRFNPVKYPDKIDTVVIDHGGNVKRCGLFEDERHWTLDLSKKEPGEVGVRPTIECPQCQAIYRGGECRNCGYAPTTRERLSQGLEFDGSELREFKPREKTKASTKTPEQLLIEALYRGGRTGRTWRQVVGIYKGLNEKQGTSHRVPRYFEIAGKRYESVSYDDHRGTRRARMLYPIVDGKHGGPFMLQAEVKEAAF